MDQRKWSEKNMGAISIELKNGMCITIAGLYSGEASSLGYDVWTEMRICRISRSLSR